MTSRERFLTAMHNGTPDRVPCTPDISNYIPAQRTGQPYWEIYYANSPPLWRAYIDAADYYGIDMWIASCAGIPTLPAEGIETTHDDRFDASRDAMVRRTTIRTAAGRLTQEQICFHNEPPTFRERAIKDLDADWPTYRAILQEPVKIDAQEIERIRDECTRRDQAFGLTIGYPGFHDWEQSVEGSIGTLAYAEADGSPILDEWRDLQTERGTDIVEGFLAASPDYLLFGGSGTLTMASPELAMRYAIPALRRWSAMAKAAGVPTMLHSCGRSRTLVDMLVEHTDIDCINPLEIAPMGDVDLAEVKRARGRQIALMGNLHTTRVMLHGSADDVYRAASRAIADAGEGGGFILSTGDQCPRDTPEENLFALRRAVADVGVYDDEGRLPSTFGG